MSTISPFVRIEGSINQPRSRAADSFPPPFRAEWALLSPEGSLRADLSALLRTFCLHDETIWSMCHWSSAWPGQPAVHLAEPASTFAMPPGERETAQASAMPLATDAPAMPLRSEFSPGVRVAGACAMGDAALLAGSPSAICRSITRNRAARRCCRRRPRATRLDPRGHLPPCPRKALCKPTRR
jgi:hypothetical protein